MEIHFNQAQLGSILTALDCLAGSVIIAAVIRLLACVAVLGSVVWFDGRSIGTKSVLLGAHCFFLHPFFVAGAWWKLYGFPFDPRLWVAFFVHDLGYIGRPNLDGKEGERHPELGARIMGALFDWGSGPRLYEGWVYHMPNSRWHDFSLYHSRYYAARERKPVSKLCFADKIAFTLTPRWLYLPMTTLTGEIREYLRNAQTAGSAHWQPTRYDKNLWHSRLCEYMTAWVETHKNGAVDTWTNANRHTQASA